MDKLFTLLNESIDNLENVFNMLPESIIESNYLHVFLTLTKGVLMVYYLLPL